VFEFAETSAKLQAENDEPDCRTDTSHCDKHEMMHIGREDGFKRHESRTRADASTSREQNGCYCGDRPCRRERIQKDGWFSCHAV